jgi:DNA-binding NarL/FixJ family response regulator
LDIGLPKLDGVAAAQRIKESVARSKILFVSQETDADVIQWALNLGLSGYIVKTDVGMGLLTAVDVSIRGQQFVSSSVAHLMCEKVQPVNTQSNNPLPKLAFEGSV